MLVGNQAAEEAETAAALIGTVVIVLEDLRPALPPRRERPADPALPRRPPHPAPAAGHVHTAVQALPAEQAGPFAAALVALQARRFHGHGGFVPLPEWADVLDRQFPAGQ